DAYRRLPAGVDINPDIHCASDCRGNSMWVAILPYIEQGAIERQYDYKLGWSHANNSTLGNHVIPLYVCPSDGKWTDYTNRRSYFGVVGGKTRDSHGWRGDVFLDGVFNINFAKRLTGLKDGTSQTMAVGESIHPSKWGLGPGYGKADVGGPVGWLVGSACLNP